MLKVSATSILAITYEFATKLVEWVFGAGRTPCTPEPSWGGGGIDDGGIFVDGGEGGARRVF